jgi:lipopolysaccharide biosynthesis glycosyltransferase
MTETVEDVRSLEQSARGQHARPIEIAFACDSNYFAALALALTSVLAHTTNRAGIHLHILDGGLKDAHRTVLMRKVVQWRGTVSLTFHPLNLDQFHGVRLLAGSVLTYARLLLPAMFPELNQILYLDVDVHYGADLDELWELPLETAGVAAVADSTTPTLGGDCPWIAPGSAEALQPYFNAGIIKINLAHWRTHSVGVEGLRIAQSEPQNCRSWDQTILNFLLKDAVQWVPLKFNTAAPSVESAPPECFAGKNLHYITNRKPWLQHSPRPTFKYWRSNYSSLVSRWPAYMLQARYWGNALWREVIVGSSLHGPMCRVLLKTRAYYLIPGMTAPRIQEQLDQVRELRARSG